MNPAEQIPPEAGSASKKISTRTDLRPAWTRNETARWLNERSAGLLAWLRRAHPETAPSHSRAMGRWLQEMQPTLFHRAHTRLSAAKETDREKLNILGVIS